MLVLGSIGIVLYGIFKPKPLVQPNPATPDVYMAYYHCQELIKPNLKAPTTAKFPTQATTATLVDNHASITSYVDSQNSFGAMIRTHWSCNADYLGNGEWQVRANFIKK